MRESICLKLPWVSVASIVTLETSCASAPSGSVLMSTEAPPSRPCTSATARSEADSATGKAVCATGTTVCMTTTAVCAASIEDAASHAVVSTSTAPAIKAAAIGRAYNPRTAVQMVANQQLVKNRVRLGLGFHITALI